MVVQPLDNIVWCDQGVIRGIRERYVAECSLEECKGLMEKGDA